jgi:surfactin synthase thioesterase subunit
LDELRRLNGIPGEVLEDVELMQIMLPGDHFFLNTTHPLLLQVLSQELRRNK